MKKIFLLLAGVLLFSVSSNNVYAQAEDDATFGLDNDDFLAENTGLPTKQTEAEAKAVFSEFLNRFVTAATARPILNAEKVFCYIVDYAPRDSEGYTVNGLAVNGYCGELSNDGRTLIKDALLNNTLAFSKSKADCKISPKILLRYVHGIDHTDILLSSPCQSLTFFHGTDITSVNAAPGAKIVDQIVTAYASLKEDFLSPAMLGQMVGNGIPQTQAQKEIIRKQAPTEAPRKKWSAEPTVQSQENTTQPETAQQPAKSGWNKLK
ncbi:MAG: hypothetical protein IJ770_03035 [Alphaproteobacteria bacterium]|nr:hypothetical protein [Alphaproteobacteria bacterium]